MVNSVQISFKFRKLISMSHFNNVNDCLDKWFNMKQQDTAIIEKNGVNINEISFGELNSLLRKYCCYFQHIGMKQGDLVLTNLIPSIEYAAIHFALFRLGCIPVIIDAGVSEEQKLTCIKNSSPDYIVSNSEGIR